MALTMSAGPTSHLLVAGGHSQVLAWGNMLRFAVVVPGILLAAPYGVLAVWRVLALASRPALITGCRWLA